jgi:hypothetical protein
MGRFCTGYKEAGVKNDVQGAYCGFRIVDASGLDFGLMLRVPTDELGGRARSTNLVESFDDLFIGALATLDRELEPPVYRCVVEPCRGGSGLYTLTVEALSGDGSSIDAYNVLVGDQELSAEQVETVITSIMAVAQVIGDEIVYDGLPTTYCLTITLEGDQKWALSVSSDREDAPNLAWYSHLAVDGAPLASDMARERIEIIKAEAKRWGDVILEFDLTESPVDARAANLVEMLTPAVSPHSGRSRQ